MAISRARKEELIAQYRQQLANSTGFIMADYTALTVAQMESMRHRVREVNGEAFVVKNTLLELVLKEQGLSVPDGLKAGATLVAFCHQTVAPVAKRFNEFAKETDENRFRVKGGMIEGYALSAQEAVAMADMPSREVLLAQVLGTINAPASQLVGVVASGIRQVLNVLQAYVDKLEGAGSASAEAAA